GENRVVVADIGAEQQRLLAVEQHLQVREMAGIREENAVRPAGRCPDVGMAVEHDKAVAMLEGTARPCGGSRPRNVEGDLRNLVDQRRGRVLPKQLEASD